MIVPGGPIITIHESRLLRAPHSYNRRKSMMTLCCLRQPVLILLGASNVCIAGEASFSNYAPT